MKKFLSLCLLTALCLPLRAIPLGSTDATTTQEAIVLNSPSLPDGNTENTCFPVQSVNILSVTKTSVAVSWNYQAAVGMQPDNVVVTLHDNADGTDHTNDQQQTVSGTYCFFTGLQSAHTYTVSVVTNCSGEESTAVSTTFGTSGCETIYDGTTAISFSPYYTSQAYSYNQNLFLASEVNQTSINALVYKVNATGTANGLLRIYIANTSLSSLSATSYVPFSELTLVADSVHVGFSSTGWVTLPFDSTFHSDGRNIVIAIHNISGTTGSGNWAGRSITGRALYVHGLTASSDISTITNFSTTDFLPAVKFVSACEDPVCLSPNVINTFSTSDAIGIAWVAGVSETEWVVDYKASTATEWNSEVVSDTGYVFSDLSANTLYNIRVGAICEEDTLYTSLDLRTACGSISTLPWTENFSSYSTTGSSQCNIPCFDFLRPGSAYISIVSDYAVSGNSMRFSGSANKPLIAILPPFEDDISGLELSLTIRAENSNDYSGTTNSPGAIRVGYITNPSDSSTFVQTARFECTTGNYSSMTTETANFAGAPAGARIAVQQVNNGTNYWWWVDNYTVYVAPSCTRPTVSVIGIDSTSATVVLHDANDINNYILIVSNGNSTDTLNVQSNAETLTDLSPNTLYTISASTICEDGTSTLPVSTNFRTECGQITLPFSEGFENYSSNTVPSCWFRTSNNGSYPYVSNNSSTAHSGTGYIYSYASTSSNAIITSPLVPTDPTDIYVSFYARGVLPGNGLLVGVLTDPADASTFIACTPQPTGDVSGSWNQYEFNTSMLNVEDPVYIAFRWTTSSYGYLDDVLISNIPSCTRPQIVSAMPTSEDATLTWTSSATDFTIYYKTSSASTYESEQVSSTDNPHTYTLENLSPITSYEYYIVANCDDGTDLSSMHRTFTTTCAAVSTLPWTENFESYSNTSSQAAIPCWDFVRGSNTNSYTCIVGDASRVHQGSHSLRFNGYAQTPLVAILPPTEANISTLELSLYALAENTSTCGNLRIGYITDITDTTTFVTTAFLSNTNFNGSYAYADALFTNAPDGARIAIEQVQNGNNNYWWWIDDLDLHPAPSCARPTLSIDSINATGVTVSISDLNEVNHYKLYIAGDSIEVNGNSQTITGLVSSSEFVLSAVTICDDGSQTAAVSVSFHTPCVGLTALPYTMDFEGQPNGSGSVPPTCWTRGDNSTSYPYVINNSGNAHNSSNFLYLYGVGNTIALPPVDNTEIDLTNVQLAFYARHGGTAANIEVGVMTNPAVSSTFQSIATVNISSAAHELYEVPLSTYNPSMGEYIAFRSTVANNIYVDDVSLEYIPSCSRPVITSITPTSDDAVIEWTSTGTDFVVYYTSSSSSEADSIVLTGSDNPHTVTLSGLAPSTYYSVYIIAICDNDVRLQGQTSSFNTTCGIITTLPWTENFDGFSSLFTSYTSQINGTCFPCWDVLYAGTSARLSLCPGSNQYNYGSQGYTPFFYPGVEYAQNILILPPFAENISNLKMSFVTRPESSDDRSGVLYVGYITNITDSSTFVPVQTYTTTQFNNAYIPDTVTFENAPAGARIAFSHRSYTNNYYWYFDDIVVSMADSTAQPTQYTVSAESADLSMGTASCTPSGLVNVGTQVTATAVPAAGYQFVSWTVGTTVVSTQNPYTFTVSHNVALTATFAVEVGIEEAESNALSLFPNPATSTVTLSGLDKDAIVSVVDLNGRTVGEYTPASSQLSFDVSTLSKGAYFVHIVGEQHSAVLKLIVK